MPSITDFRALLSRFITLVVLLGLLVAAAGNDAVNLCIASYVCFGSIEGDGETDR